MGERGHILPVGCTRSLGSVCPCPSFMVTLDVSGRLRGTSGQPGCTLPTLSSSLSSQDPGEELGRGGTAEVTH